MVHIVEEGMQIRKDITVMCPNVRDQKFVRNIKRGCANTNSGSPWKRSKEEGFEQAKAYAVATEDIKREF
jgi:hypothetical protein